jgi:Mn2+/Fe2+ NRAMP family transporter
MYGVARGTSLALAVIALLFLVASGSYRRVERAAIVVGLFEFAFFIVAFKSHPALHELRRDIFNVPVHDGDYLYLAAANIGTVIMPWMIFYQQSAIADKGLRPEHFRAARWDTAMGAVITQLVMAAVLITCAATIAPATPPATLSTVGQMSQALSHFLGQPVGRLVFGIGVLGAGLAAAIVATLPLAWGIGEITGYKHSLELHALAAPWFYGVYAACVAVAAVIVWRWSNLISLNIGVQVLNALLLAAGTWLSCCPRDSGSA